MSIMWLCLDQDFDGDRFMCSSEENFKELFPGKIEIVKKLIRLQQTVCRHAKLCSICMDMQYYETW